MVLYYLADVWTACAGRVREAEGAVGRVWGGACRSGEWEPCLPIAMALTSRLVAHADIKGSTVAYVCVCINEPSVFRQPGPIVAYRVVASYCRTRRSPTDFGRCGFSNPPKIRHQYPTGTLPKLYVRLLLLLPFLLSLLSGY